jgi:hypothetical protein
VPGTNHARRSSRQRAPGKADRNRSTVMRSYGKAAVAPTFPSVFSWAAMLKPGCSGIIVPYQRRLTHDAEFARNRDRNPRLGEKLNSRYSRLRCEDGIRCQNSDYPGQKYCSEDDRSRAQCGHCFLDGANAVRKHRADRELRTHKRLVGNEMEKDARVVDSVDLDRTTVVSPGPQCRDGRKRRTSTCSDCLG